jgi:hypothetical protein
MIMPEMMTLNARIANSSTQMGMIANLRHGELGCPLSYLPNGSVVMKLVVSVTEMYGAASAIVKTQLRMRYRISRSLSEST